MPPPLPRGLSVPQNDDFLGKGETPEPPLRSSDRSWVRWVGRGAAGGGRFGGVPTPGRVLGGIREGFWGVWVGFCGRGKWLLVPAPPKERGGEGGKWWFYFFVKRKFRPRHFAAPRTEGAGGGFGGWGDPPADGAARKHRDPPIPGWEGTFGDPLAALLGTPTCFWGEPWQRLALPGPPKNTTSGGSRYPRSPFPFCAPKSGGSKPARGQIWGGGLGGSGGAPAVYFGGAEELPGVPRCFPARPSRVFVASVAFVRSRGGRRGALSPKRGGTVPKKGGGSSPKRRELPPKKGRAHPQSLHFGVRLHQTSVGFGAGAPPPPQSHPDAVFRVLTAPQKLLPSSSRSSRARRGPRGQEQEPKKPPALFKAPKLPPLPAHGEGGSEVRGPRNSPLEAAACPGTPVCEGLGVLGGLGEIFFIGVSSVGGGSVPRGLSGFVSPPPPMFFGVFWGSRVCYPFIPPIS